MFFYEVGRFVWRAIYVNFSLVVAILGRVERARGQGVVVMTLCRYHVNGARLRYVILHGLRNHSLVSGYSIQVSLCYGSSIEPIFGLLYYALGSFVVQVVLCIVVNGSSCSAHGLFVH